MEIRKPDLIAYVTAYGHYVPRLDERDTNDFLNRLALIEKATGRTLSHVLPSLLLC